MKYEFRAGDPFVYVTVKQLHCGLNHNNCGKTGVVVRSLATDCASTSAVVRFDNRDCNTSVFVGNIIKIDPEQVEIERAIALLKKHGKVEFKKNKPPFTPIFVTVNLNHTAEVFDTHIAVGCQIVAFEAIDELAEAVAAARKYNEEK